MAETDLVSGGCHFECRTVAGGMYVETAIPVFDQPLPVVLRANHVCPAAPMTPQSLRNVGLWAQSRPPQLAAVILDLNGDNWDAVIPAVAGWSAEAHVLTVVRVVSMERCPARLDELPEDVCAGVDRQRLYHEVGERWHPCRAFIQGIRALLYQTNFSPRLIVQPRRLDDVLSPAIERTAAQLKRRQAPSAG